MINKKIEKGRTERKKANKSGFREEGMTTDTDILHTPPPTQTPPTPTSTPINPPTQPQTHTHTHAKNEAGTQKLSSFNVRLLRTIGRRVETRDHRVSVVTDMLIALMGIESQTQRQTNGLPSEKGRGNRQ